MLFKRGNISVRRIRESDAGLLFDWITDPRVLEYYEEDGIPPNLDALKKDFICERTHGKINGCIVEYQGKPIGFIQFYTLTKEDLLKYGDQRTECVYGLDQYLGDSNYWGRGIGTLLINSMVEYLFTTKGADRVVMDPQTWNTRALRCYEKCGFKRVRLLPKHEMHKGIMRDCWLIERMNPSPNGKVSKPR